MQHRTARTASWRWWISGLLLLAMMINYMDRLTLANLSVRITDQFQLTQEQYGNLEFVFGLAFAAGAIFFGMIADRISVRWAYPIVLVAWSAMGFATGLTEGYPAMLVCRLLLGFFEAGNMPCAMVVIQSVMTGRDRVMGNSILQSGASIGAVLTPLIIRLLVGDNREPDAWRPPFLVIGAAGSLWAVLWLIVVKPGDLRPAVQAAPGSAVPLRLAWLREFIRDRRFWALVMTTISINSCWQLVRAWLPKFLQQGRGYTEAESLYFNSAYYVATDVGCLLAGAFAFWLAGRGTDVHVARLKTFAVCAALTSLTVVAAALPQGWPLLCVLLVIGAGSLGLFPCYYSFVQEFSSGHVGKASGVLAFMAWMATSPLQKLFGRLVDRTGSFDLPLGFIGGMPLLGLAAMLVLWPKQDRGEEGGK